MGNLKIKFDTANNPEMPTFVLAKRSGEKLGKIEAENIVVSGDLNNPSEFSFVVHKYTEVNGKKVKNHLWDYIVDFKFVWLKEYDKWYEIVIDKTESTDITKNVSGTEAEQAELSQIVVYNTEINTEDDIARDDYVEPTVFYNSSKPECSLLDRLLDKAPHYRIAHVDSSLKDIQRTFSFDGKSIYDCFSEVAEEINCVFVYKSASDTNGYLDRAIYVYDLQNVCLACGTRGDFETQCSECDGTNIKAGYGSDTNIFVTADELASGDISFTTDTDSVKNCFKLEAGDDLMTATVRNCNPNGSDYIWYISDDLKTDMSDELVAKINEYDEQYDYYCNAYSCELNSDAVTSYNNLITKYKSYKSTLKSITSPIVGYSNLMVAYYDTIDFVLFLQSELMPTVTLSSTSASTEAAKITKSALSPVAVQDTSIISLATANSAVLKMAKTIVRSTYQVKINTSSLEDTTWTGSFKVTNYSDEEDTAISSTISVTLSDDYQSYVEQLISKALDGSITDEDNDAVDISSLFKLDVEDFTAELPKYCLARLNSFYDACQECINILIEQGIADDTAWTDLEDADNLYNQLYIPYYNKMKSLESEIKVREDEIAIISGVYDEDGLLETSGLQNVIYDKIQDIQNILNFEEYLGEKLWLEFITYRRDDKYTNSNYISDGLSNSELFDNALEFLKVARNEIYKSAELQHSISTSLKDLFVIDKFKTLVDYFEVGNWIRILVDDVVYKLRLIHFEIDYDNIDEISVEFSDVMKTAFGMDDKQSLMENVQSMTTSYSATQKQASNGNDSKKQISEWVSNGLALTKMKIIDNADEQNISWDEHGLLCRRYNPITEDYEDKQLKIINSGLYLTDDNWLTSRAGIGNFTFYNPITGEMEESYGVIADTLVGSLILGEQVGVYTKNGNITLDESGLTITSGATDETKTLFTINSTITNDDGEEELVNLMHIDSSGHLVIRGDVRFDSIGGDESSYTIDDKIENYQTEMSKIIADYQDDANGSLRRAYWASTDYAKSILESYKSDVGKYMKFDSDVGLVLGAESSNFSTTIDNQGMFFREDNQIVAYVTNQQLYIPSAVIEDSLTIGNFVFVNRNDGGFSVIWRDDYSITGITVKCSMSSILVGKDYSEISGIIVRAIYSNSSTSIVTNYTISSGTIVKGTNTVNVYYKDYTASFTITGNETNTDTNSSGSSSGYDGDIDSAPDIFEEES